MMLLSNSILVINSLALVICLSNICSLRQINCDYKIKQAEEIMAIVYIIKHD